MKYYLSVLLFVFSVHGISQIKSIDSCLNKFDKKGNKTGLWKFYNNEGELIKDNYYKNGKLDGIERTYYSNGKIMTISFYKNGENTGVFYSFNRYGQIVFTINYIEKVVYKNAEYVKGFFKIYNCDGSVKKSYKAIFKKGEEELGEEILN